MANACLTAIEHAFQALLDTPLMGAKRGDLGAGLRSFFITHTPSIIFPTETAVVTVRVLHGARNAAATARGGRVWRMNEELIVSPTGLSSPATQTSMLTAEHFRRLADVPLKLNGLPISKISRRDVPIKMHCRIL